MKKKVSFAERLTGLFVLSAILIIVIVFVLSAYKREWFQKKLYLVTYAAEGYGITVGTKVFFKGTPAGAVMERPRIEKEPSSGLSKVHILMSIFAENAEDIPVDSKALIQAPFAGFGETKIMLTGGDITQSYKLSAKPYVIESGVTTGMAAEVAAAITELEVVREVTGVLKRANALLSEIESRKESLIGSFDSALGNAAVIAGDISAGRGIAGKLVKDEVLARDIAAITSDMRAMVSDMRRDITEITASLNAIMKKFRGDEIDRVVRLAPELMESAESLSRTATGTLNDLQPLLIQGKQLIEKLQTAMEDANRILADAKVISSDVRNATGDLPRLMDTIDFSLKETTRVVTAVKENWLIKGFLPDVKEPESRLISTDLDDPYAP